MRRAIGEHLLDQHQHLSTQDLESLLIGTDKSPFSLNRRPRVGGTGAGHAPPPSPLDLGVAQGGHSFASVDGVHADMVSTRSTGSGFVAPSVATGVVGHGLPPALSVPSGSPGAGGVAGAVGTRRVATPGVRPQAAMFGHGLPAGSPAMNTRAAGVTTTTASPPNGVATTQFGMAMPARGGAAGATAHGGLHHHRSLSEIRTERMRTLAMQQQQQQQHQQQRPHSLPPGGVVGGPTAVGVSNLWPAAPVPAAPPAAPQNDAFFAAPFTIPPPPSTGQHMPASAVGMAMPGMAGLGTPHSMGSAMPSALPGGGGAMGQSVTPVGQSVHAHQHSGFHTAPPTSGGMGLLGGSAAPSPGGFAGHAGMGVLASTATPPAASANGRLLQSQFRFGQQQ